MSEETVGGVDPETHYAALMSDRDRYRRWYQDTPLFLPWRHSSSICDGLDDVELLSLNDRPRLYYLAALGRHAAQLGGPFAECGVFRGGTALLLSRVSAAQRTPLHLIDSFDGLPEPDGRHDRFYRRGDFGHTDDTMVVDLLAEAGPRTFVYKGWIPEILSALPEQRWALVHVDVDLFAPTRDVCAYFYDKLLPGAVMVFDEYGFPTCRGERDAVDGFFQERRETPVVLPTGQAFVIKI